MVYIACDHGGLELKAAVIKMLKARGEAVTDLGTDSDKSVDYPDYALKVAHAVADGACEMGILICGTGIGMSIAANKVRGIRCALCGDTFSARATREHNDANILALGERVIGKGLALDIVDTFVHTAFSGDARHARRIAKIAAIEENG